jgi:hypothetical protein
MEFRRKKVAVQKSLPPKKIERLLKIDALIRSRTRYTASLLAETLEVSDLDSHPGLSLGQSWAMVNGFRGYRMALLLG